MAARNDFPTVNLTGMRIVVTGASKGIGRGLAVGLGRLGAAVAVNYKSDRAGANEVVAEIRAAGGTAELLQLDISDHGESLRIVSASVDLLGGIDVLINNAGRTMFGPPSGVTLEAWDYVVNTNIRGLMFSSIQVAEYMRAGSGGSIINISSCAATLMVPDHALYTTSKSAVEGLTRQLALEYAPGVRVNAIAPGPSAVQRNFEYDTDFEHTWGAVIPMGRVADPADDLLGPVIFLATGLSRYITGEIIHADGGWNIRGCTPDMSVLDYQADRTRG